MTTPTRIPAASYHADVREMRGAFTVQATFSRAWHLRARNGCVLSVTTAPYNGPLAVRLARPSLHDLPVLSGMRASLRDSELVVGPVKVMLETGVAWSPRPIQNALPVSPEALQRDLARISQCHAGSESLSAAIFVARTQSGYTEGLRAPRNGAVAAGGDARRDPEETTRSMREGAATEGRATSPSGSGLLARRLANAIVALGTALVQANGPSIQSHAHALLGLGPGLTPGGDDVLCGLLAGLQVLGRRSLQPYDGLRNSLAGALESAAGSRTTALSRTLIHYAGRGVVLEPLLDVLWFLGSGAPIAGLDALLRTGHSSGSDMLAGALLAAASLAGRGNSSARALTCPA